MVDGSPNASRRSFLFSGCAAFASVALAGAWPLGTVAAVSAGAGVSPEAALERLKAGNVTYVSKMVGSRVNTLEERAALGDGQAPWASILTCADSRTAPEILFNQGLGDVFVVRVAGNVPGTTETASLEYASAVLGSQLAVVMGHSGCGAVKSAIEYANGTPMASEDLTKLVEAIQPAIRRAKQANGDPLTAAIKANASIGAEQLRAIPILKARVAEHKLRIVPAYCDLKTGKVTWL